MDTTSYDLSPSVRLVAWKDLRKRLPSEFSARLQRMVPAAKAAKANLVTVRYPFGALLVDNGQYIPPQDADPAVRAAVASAFPQGNQPRIPLGVILSGSAEVFSQLGTDAELCEEIVADGDKKVFEKHLCCARHRVVSQRLLTAGEFFGAFEMADFLASRHTGDLVPTYRNYSISAGARSVHLLWPLQNKTIASALSSHLEIEYDALKNMQEGFSWHVLRWVAAELYKANALSWFAEVFYVPHEWFMRTGEKSLELREYLLSRAWAQSSAMRCHDVDVAQLPEALTQFHRKCKKGVRDELLHPRCVSALAAIKQVSVGTRTLSWPLVAPAEPSHADAPAPDDAPAGPFSDILASIAKGCNGKHDGPLGKTLAFLKQPHGKVKAPIVLYPVYLTHGMPSMEKRRGLLSLSMPSYGLSDVQTGEWKRVQKALGEFFSLDGWQEALSLDTTQPLWACALRKIQRKADRSIGNGAVTALRLTNFKSSVAQMVMSAVAEEASDSSAEEADFFDGHTYFQCAIVLERE